MTDTIDKLEKLANLHREGLITKAQFEAERDRLLGRGVEPLSPTPHEESPKVDAQHRGHSTELGSPVPSVDRSRRKKRRVLALVGRLSVPLIMLVIGATMLYWQGRDATKEDAKLSTAAVEPIFDAGLDQAASHQETSSYENPSAGEGAKAKQEEGKVSKKDAKMEKAKGNKVEMNKRQVDKELATSAGVMGALRENPESDAVFDSYGVQEDLRDGTVLLECWGDVDRDGTSERVVLVSSAGGQTAKIVVLENTSAVLVYEGPLIIPAGEGVLICNKGLVGWGVRDEPGSVDFSWIWNGQDFEDASDVQEG